MAALNRYATPTAFRRALEDRLKLLANAEGLDLQRLLREVAFDRLLARLFAKTDAPWVLKGGYAMELRIKEARATKDIDLALRQAIGQGRGRPLNRDILAELQEAAGRDLGDFFSYAIGEAVQDLGGAPYGGARFPVQARMDARTFVKFHVDVGVGDMFLTPLEMIEGSDWLKFAGIRPAKCPTISEEQHFAEKLHAYTLPRQAPNSRTRDLVDMVLLIGRNLDKKKVAADIAATFQRRKTHAVPSKLEPPPSAWERPFALLAVECGLPPDIEAAFSVLNEFFITLGLQ
jgi:predicted nucleotidyltransferase component of viral defense system